MRWQQKTGCNVPDPNFPRFHFSPVLQILFDQIQHPPQNDRQSDRDRILIVSGEETGDGFYTHSSVMTAVSPVLSTFFHGNRYWVYYYYHDITFIRGYQHHVFRRT